MKAWKFFRQVPISSFYLELRVAKYAENETSILYEYDIQRVFDLLYRNNLANLQDPMGISGYIRPCKTESMLENARSKVLTASVRADKALAAFKAENFKDAFYWWNLLYDGKFPSYYR